MGTDVQPIYWLRNITGSPNNMCSDGTVTIASTRQNSSARQLIRLQHKVKQLEEKCAAFEHKLQLERAQNARAKTASKARLKIYISSVSCLDGLHSHTGHGGCGCRQEVQGTQLGTVEVWWSAQWSLVQ